MTGLYYQNKSRFLLQFDLINPTFSVYVATKLWLDIHSVIRQNIEANCTRKIDNNRSQLLTHEFCHATLLSRGHFEPSLLADFHCLERMLTTLSVLVSFSSSFKTLNHGFDPRRQGFYGTQTEKSSL